jgi:(p)ppGpp synthase/HD superfamily hydrolase
MLTSRFTSALQLAVKAHDGQYRKYGHKVPYVTHPIAVAHIVYSSLHSVLEAKELDIITSAAVLHDVIEDTPTTAEDMAKVIGDEITELVLQVTKVSKPSDGDRATRVEIDRQHFIKASWMGGTIKLADCFHNMRDIEKQDSGFAKVYMAEKKALIPYLSGYVALKNAAMAEVNRFFMK